MHLYAPAAAKQIGKSYDVKVTALSLRN